MTGFEEAICVTCLASYIICSLWTRRPHWQRKQETPVRTKIALCRATLRNIYPRISVLMIQVTLYTPSIPSITPLLHFCWPRPKLKQHPRLLKQVLLDSNLCWVAPSGSPLRLSSLQLEITNMTRIPPGRTVSLASLSVTRCLPHFIQC